MHVPIPSGLGEPVLGVVLTLCAESLKDKLEFAVQVLDVCDSTNRLARQAARDWDGQRASRPLIVAHQQTAGRGRLGRSWEAAAGENLLFSAVLTPQVPVARAARCVMVWAAVMAEALDLRVKWPNDIVTDDHRKVGGILAELETTSVQGVTQVAHMILGVGLNVNQRDFPGLPDATSLAVLRGNRQSREEVLCKLTDALDRADVHSDKGLALWRARTTTLGRRVEIGEVRGVAEDIRDDGALIVAGRPVLAGDVSLLD